MQIGFLRELLELAKAYELGGGSTDQLDPEDLPVGCSLISYS